MTLSYTELKEKINKLEGRLNVCINKIKELKPEEKRRYLNPQLRLWSGDVRDLEKFVNELEEWLNQPLAAEAKKYLLILKNLSAEEIRLEDIENDWRFLSNNVRIIEKICKEIKDIKYEDIKRKSSKWVIERIVEKDLERAITWAENANKFSINLKNLESKKVRSRLAEKVKRDSIIRLLQIESFDSDHMENISRYERLIEKSDDIIINKPQEIREEAILTTYNRYHSEDIRERIERIIQVINKIKNILRKIEWVDEIKWINSYKKYSSPIRAYKKLLENKREAYQEGDLEKILNKLEKIKNQAEQWEEEYKKVIEGEITRVKRMLKFSDNKHLYEFSEICEQFQSIDWSKLDVKLLFDITFKIDDIKRKLRKELLEKIKNENAIKIIEKPELVEDLGESEGWDINTFIEALGILLRNGLIKIKVVEEPI